MHRKKTRRGAVFEPRIISTSSLSPSPTTTTCTTSTVRCARTKSWNRNTSIESFGNASTERLVRWKPKPRLVPCPGHRQGGPPVRRDPEAPLLLPLEGAPVRARAGEGGRAPAQVRALRRRQGRLEDSSHPAHPVQFREPQAAPRRVEGHSRRRAGRAVGHRGVRLRARRRVHRREQDVRGGARHGVQGARARLIEEEEGGNQRKMLKNTKRKLQKRLGVDYAYLHRVQLFSPSDDGVCYVTLY